MIFNLNLEPPIGFEKSTYSPSGACAGNPCEHGGICIPKGQMTYECKCVGPWRGIYCGVGMSLNFITIYIYDSYPF